MALTLALVAAGTLAPDTWQLASGTEQLAPDTCQVALGSLALGTWQPGTWQPGKWHMAPWQLWLYQLAWHLAAGKWYRTAGTWQLACGTWQPCQVAHGSLAHGSLAHGTWHLAAWQMALPAQLAINNHSHQKSEDHPAYDHYINNERGRPPCFDSRWLWLYRPPSDPPPAF
jgi:hypothetical protein